MGAGEVAAAVADSGPLIHLHEAGCLPLVAVFASVRAPEEVWREVVGQGYVPEADLLACHVGREPHPSDIEAFVATEGLGHLHEQAERLLRRLRDDTSLFVTPTIVDLAIEQLRNA